MKYDELIASIGKSRQKPSDEEHRIQVECVRWFRLQYPKLRNMLFAVPNGSIRDKITGARLKAEGVTPGVADLLLLIPNRFYGCLAVEMKTAKGRQSDTQKAWEAEMFTHGNKYVVCHNFDEFKAEIEEYLKNT